MSQNGDVAIVTRDGLVTIEPQGWTDPESLVEDQTIPVLGGTIAFRPDAPAGTLPRTLVIAAEPALLWLSAVYGTIAAEAVRAAAAAGSDSTVTIAAAPEHPELADALRQLARAEWYQRWWPSHAAGDEWQPRLDSALLDLDLGTLAWECGLFLESDDLAAARLGRSTRVLLALLGHARALTGATREYVDGRLAQAIDATLDSEAGPEDHLDAVAAHRNRESEIDAAVRAAMQAWPAEFARHDADLALVAGDADGSTDRTVRFSTVDWTLVPARSVSGNDLNVALLASEATGGLRIDARVDAGDEPVPGLLLYLHASPRQTLVARLELRRDGALYVGSTVVPTLELVEIDRVSAHVVCVDLRPSPYFPDRPVPWLAPTRLARAVADRAFVRGVLRANLVAAPNVANRPLLCELDLG